MIHGLMPRVVGVLIILVGVFLAHAAEASTLSLSPSTGVYTSGETFSATVRIDTAGESVNAAEATLSFRPSELQVVSVSNSSSIFALWTADPTYSNDAGTVSFSGGTPQGYTGSRGTVVTITFRAVSSGSHDVSFSDGAVLAADGRGTNILNRMQGASYTIKSESVQPEPEEIEYVAPPNTPSAPVVRSDTHADGEYTRATSAHLTWQLPTGITAVRTLLDTNPTSIPTKVYEPPISELTVDELDQGVQYVHVQFRNADGWGRVTHYQLAVDSESPSDFTITQSSGTDPASPTQTLELNVTDATSPVDRYQIQLDDAEPYEYIDETGSSTITLTELAPGRHSVIVEAFDAAGNSRVATYAFTVEAFTAPQFTDYPDQVNEGVIPVIKGTTRPDAEVRVTLEKMGDTSAAPQEYVVTANASGTFTVIPEGSLSTGRYALTAVAIDENGAQSDPSSAVHMAVQQPGYIQIGSLLVSVLSIVVPLIALIALLILGVWYAIYRIRRLRRRVRRESTEALATVTEEFDGLTETLEALAEDMRQSRRSKKHTKAEAKLVSELQEAMAAARQRVEKEVQDVRSLLPDQKK